MVVSVVGKPFIARAAGCFHTKAVAAGDRGCAVRSNGVFHCFGRNLYVCRSQLVHAMPCHHVVFVILYFNILFSRATCVC